MLNREKVIGALTACARGNITCKQSGCPYWGEYDDCIGKMARDALELLKEQEPVKPRKILPCITRPVGGYVCGHCGIRFLEKNDYYCPNCGMAVKWDEYEKC